MNPRAQLDPKRYSEAEMRKILDDVLDPEKVQLVCGAHNYIASEKPPEPRGCKNCWEAWWWHKIATTPPHLRQERLEGALQMLSHAVELHEKGKFDFEPFDRAVAEIKKDAEPN